MGDSGIDGEKRIGDIDYFGGVVGRAIGVDKKDAALRGISSGAAPAVPEARLLAVFVAEVIVGGHAPELPVFQQMQDVLLGL